MKNKARSTWPLVDLTWSFDRLVSLLLTSGRHVADQSVNLHCIRAGWLDWRLVCRSAIIFRAYDESIQHVGVAATLIASRLSELRSCVVSVLCSVISATVSKLRPMKLPVFFFTGRVLWACSTPPTGRPRIALPRGLAHVSKQIKITTMAAQGPLHTLTSINPPLPLLLHYHPHSPPTLTITSQFCLINTNHLHQYTTLHPPIQLTLIALTPTHCRPPSLT